MSYPTASLSRRSFLASTAGAAVTLAAHSLPAAEPPKTRIAVSLDLEMCRNFPAWDDTHWDYEKGNLDDATKEYALEAARRIKAAGGRVHFFALGRTLEQANVDWLLELIREGHRIGNHTYDHVNLMAKTPAEIQYRFQRSPWLIEGEEPQQTIARNIRLAERAMIQRLGTGPSGFRTPGGYPQGLRERPDLQELLLGQGYRWVSSVYPRHEVGTAGAPPTPKVLESIDAGYAASQPFVYPSGLVELPMSPVSDIGAFRNARWPLEAFLDVTRRGIEWTIANRAVFDFLGHPACLVAKDPEFKTIDLIARLVKGAESKATFATLDEIAAPLQPT